MSAAQDKAPLSISVSPTTVSPGETVLVTLASPAKVSFPAVAVISEMGVVPAPTLPATVAIQVPEDMSIGEVGISAFGRTVSGEMVTVVAKVAVERGGLPAKLSSEVSTFEFRMLGDELPSRILADFPDDPKTNVTYSSHIAYASSNPRVASVDKFGTVTAVGAGRASLTVTYTHGAESRRVVMPVIVPPPPFGVSPTPLDFGDVALQSTASRTITVTNTTQEPLPIPTVEVGDQDVFAVTDTCTRSSPLAVGASCTMTVTFKPGEAGRQTGRVWLESTDLRMGLSVAGTGVSRE